MMLKNNHSKNDIKETLSPILRVLSQLGGKFSFTDGEGRQFVIMQQDDLKSMMEEKEKQLSLADIPDKAASADDVLEKINREIALWQMQEREEEQENDLKTDDIEDKEPEFHESQNGVPAPPPIKNDQGANDPGSSRRVRFEPLKGDLDPELQD